MSRTRHISADPATAKAGRELDKTRHEAKLALEQLRTTGSREAHDAFVLANEKARAAYETFKRLAFGGEHD